MIDYSDEASKNCIFRQPLEDSNVQPIWGTTISQSSVKNRKLRL